MQEKTFEIGLVMAGAISAGAYTAGVVDYLLQALKEWENTKNENPQDAPPHNVQLKVIAGSSAGGMTGAILTSMINGPFEAITSLPDREPDEEEIAKNNLYSAWVEQIDISKLLGKKDLKKEAVKLFLCLIQPSSKKLQIQPFNLKLTSRKNPISPNSYTFI